MNQQRTPSPDAAAPTPRLPAFRIWDCPACQIRQVTSVPWAGLTCMHCWSDMFPPYAKWLSRPAPFVC